MLFGFNPDHNKQQKEYSMSYLTIRLYRFFLALTLLVGVLNISACGGGGGGGSSASTGQFIDSFVVLYIAFYIFGNPSWPIKMIIAVGSSFRKLFTVSSGTERLGKPLGTVPTTAPPPIRVS